MVAIQAVSEVEGGDGNNLPAVLMRKQVRGVHIEYRVTAGSGLSWKNAVLIFRHHGFRRESQTLISRFEPDATSQWRDARQRCVRVPQLRIDIVDLREQPDITVQSDVEASLRSS